MSIRLATVFCAYKPEAPARDPPTGERIRQWLKDEHEITPLAELFLFSAARASLVESVIRPALRNGEIVVCDRYIYSTVAYQGYGRGLDADTIRQLNAIATGELVPDIVVLLDLSPEESFNRKLGTPLDRIEREQHDFHQRVREGYLEMAEKDPERWLVLDSTQSRQSLSDLIWRQMERLL